MEKISNKKMLCCPFCESYDLHVAFDEYYWIFCDECSSAGPVKETKEEAEDAWNILVDRNFEE